MIKHIVGVSKQVGYGFVDMTAFYSYNEHSLDGEMTFENIPDDAKYVLQLPSIEIEILAEFGPNPIKYEENFYVRFIDHEGGPVIIPYAYREFSKDVLSTDEQVMIIDAIKEAGIDLKAEMNYTADVLNNPNSGSSYKAYHYRVPEMKEGDTLDTNEIRNEIIKDMDIARELGLTIKEYRVLRADIRYYKNCRRVEKIKAMTASGYSYDEIAETMKLPASTIKALAESHKCTSELSDKRDSIRSEYWKMIDNICEEYDL